MLASLWGQVQVLSTTKAQAPSPSPYLKKKFFLSKKKKKDGWVGTKSQVEPESLNKKSRVESESSRQCDICLV